MEHFRWIAVVTYRAEAGPIEMDHHLVVVRLNPKRAVHPGSTIEAAERR
jgi:hypothetical protein